MPNEENKIVDQGSQVTEEKTTSTSRERSTLSKPKWLKWILGVVILFGIGYGAYSLGQNQNANLKSQNDNAKLKNTETPIVQTPTATKLQPRQLP